MEEDPSAGIDIKKYSLWQFLGHLSLGSIVFLSTLIAAIVGFAFWLGGLRIQATNQSDQQAHSSELEQREKEIVSLKKQNEELQKQLSAMTSKAESIKKDPTPLQAHSSSVPVTLVYAREKNEPPQKLIERVRKAHGVRPLRDIEDGKEARELSDPVYGFTGETFYNTFTYNPFHRFPSKDTYTEVHLLAAGVFVIGFVTLDDATKVKEEKAITLYPKPWIRAEDVLIAIPASKIAVAWQRKIQADDKSIITALDVSFGPKKKL